MGQMSDIAEQSKWHNVANALMWLVRKMEKSERRWMDFVWKTVHFCTQVTVEMTLGNELSALECELHFIIPCTHIQIACLVLCQKTFYFTYHSLYTHSECLLGLLPKNIPFHLPSLKLAFNLLATSCYHKEQQMTDLRCNAILLPGWLPDSKGLQESLETDLINNYLPLSFSIYLSPSNFRLKLISATYKDGAAAKKIKASH